MPVKWMPVIRRLLVFCAGWAVFWWVSTVLYSIYIHDVGATYWALGGLEIIVLAPLYLALELACHARGWARRRMWRLTVISLAVSFALYCPLLWLGLVLA